MSETLVNACNGKTKGNGGLNLPEFRSQLSKKYPSQSDTIKNAKRKELQSLCKRLLKDVPVKKRVTFAPKKVSLKRKAPKEPRVDVCRRIGGKWVCPMKKVPKVKIPKIKKPAVSKRTIHYEPVRIKPTKTGDRLSARWYYDNYGDDSTVGDRCNIRKDGEYKCLLKRDNGSPYWAGCTKGTLAKHSECGDCSSNCQYSDFM